MALEPEDLDPDPLIQLRHWLSDAEQAGVRLPGAMALATADASGTPSVRMVLLRGLDDRGLVYFTNRQSPKAGDVAARPEAAICFFWETLDRQVRVSGNVHEVDSAESATYFASRPRGSQLSAWASEQSRPIESRSLLEARVAAVSARFSGTVPPPPSWSGYRLDPHHFEFWESRPDRLHDRIEYRRANDGAWRRGRLQP